MKSLSTSRINQLLSGIPSNKRFISLLMDKSWLNKLFRSLKVKLRLRFQDTMRKMNILINSMFWILTKKLTNKIYQIYPKKKPHLKKTSILRMTFSAPILKYPWNLSKTFRIQFNRKILSLTKKRL